VSIIVPIIDTESTFTECVRLWLKCEPREIIIVTVPRNKDRVLELLGSLQEETGKIITLIAPLANKRQQLSMGIKAARGEIIALVDDDVYWSVDTVVPYLLAPFENEKVGAVAGIQRFVSCIRPRILIIDLNLVLRFHLIVKTHESLQPGKLLPFTICIK